MPQTPPPPFPTGEPGFVQDLCKPEIPKIRYAASRSPKFRLEAGFPDPEGLLETAYFHLKRFWDANGIAGSFPVATRQCTDLEGEAWRLTAGKDGVTLESATTEGIRRGVYELVEQLSIAPEPTPVVRTPWLKNRVSRCFFGPIKRPPFNHDELTDDIDYYPEEYLQKLARDGVNGIWLTIVFREICSTPYFPEDPRAEQRRAKLRRTVERCRRYGIKVWAFAIEPIYWSPQNPPPPDHPEWVGPSGMWHGKTFCIDSESARDYLYQSTNSLFGAVPHLGGLMLISLGERPTSCLSSLHRLRENDRPCPRCQRSVGNILRNVLDPMVRGMKDANPDAELLSWLYQPWREQHGEWTYHLPEELDSRIILAYNCESGCEKMQTGKVRTGGDYWQSARPSDRFGRVAEAAKGHCRFAAKMQVCCSHEMATVPFVPVPGMLYRKYKVLRDLGVTDVIQCWYFGNYPGMMNRAAGKLAFVDFRETDEETFLRALALPDWGENAEAAVRAWRKFDAAYECYPLNIQMQYYGPAHDGAVWPLYLRRQMGRLPRTWKPELEPAGDAVGECLDDFTIAEAAALTDKMRRLWSEGMAELAGLGPDAGPGNELVLYEAIDLHCRAMADIFEFYRLRAMLMDGADVLDDMAEIVRAEIAVSKRLEVLAETDSRLGYHSEAEVFKYFPAKLAWRAAELERLLAEDFPACRASGDAAAWVRGDAEVLRPDTWYGDEKLRWRFTPGVRVSTFDVEAAEPPRAEGEFAPEIVERIELAFMDEKLAAAPWASLTVEIASGNVEFGRDAAELERFEPGDPRKLRLKIQSGMLPEGNVFAFALRHAWRGGARCFPEKSFQPPDTRLRLDHFTPEHLAFLAKEKN